MEPKLSLNYSSQSGNGLLGVGWSLGGLGGVGRCPRTMAQDGVRGGVNYDSNDRYCLDGQRLIAISGSEGGDGTEYRTERESFAKIVSYGSAGNGPAWFKVWTKAGQVMEYGRTTDSRIEAQGKVTARIWGLNRIEDTKGNYLTVTYIKDTTYGDYYPSRIDYTGNSRTNTIAINSVQFQYEARSDVVPVYQGGSLIKQQMRLSEIVSLRDALQTKRYEISYTNTPYNLRSVIAKVQECGDTCRPSLSFAWSGMSAEASWQEQPSYAMPENLAADGYGDIGTRLIDLNGDGLPDFIYGRHTQSGVEVKKAWLNTGSGWVEAPNYAPPKYLASDGYADVGARLIDLNGDGLPDFVFSYYLNGVSFKYAWLNTGDGWAEASNYATPDHLAADGYGDVGTRFVDLNGDGLPDFIYGRHTQSGVEVKKAWLNTGSGWVEAPNYAPPKYLASDGYADVGARLIDLNGDGLPDFVFSYYLNGVSFKYVWLNTGNGWVEAPNYATPDHLAADGYGDVGTRLVDLNGDGLPDFIYGRYTQSGVEVKKAWLNTGSGWVEAPNYAPPKYLASDDYADVGARFIDLNGDGLPDFVFSYYLNGVSFKYAWLNTGNGWVEAPNYATPDHLSANGYGDVGTRLIDIDGDSQVDFVYSRYLISGASVKKTWRNTTQLNMINSIKNGLSLGTSISYGAITDKALYKKDPDGSYPLQNVQTPLYVVTAVAYPNGVDGITTTNYTYGGLKSDQAGRGLLGFRWMQAKQVETGLTSYTEYQQTWPYTGLPSLIKKSLSGGGNNGVLSQVNNSYACNDAAIMTATACAVGVGKRYFVYASQSIESGWDYNGAVLPVITTKTEYDNWGNATKVDVSTSDGYGKTTGNIYSNDSSNWYLGRLLKSTVMSTAP